MYSPNKHSYLQSRTQEINPRLLNRSVNLARIHPTTDGYDLEPPYLRLCSEQPCIPIPNVDITRRPLAFGRWALRKLRGELHDKDVGVVIAALTTIIDLLRNPEKGFESIRLEIPNRMSDLLKHSVAAIRERTCMALTQIARLGEGRAVIVKNKKTVKHIYMILKHDIPEVRFKAAILLEEISFVWMYADVLVTAGFITLVLKVLPNEVEEIIEVHLDILKNLMYGEGKIEVLENRGFETFVSAIKKMNKYRMIFQVKFMNAENVTIRSKSATCLMMVTTVKIGKELAYDTGILNILNNLLHSELVEIYTSAASAIMFCTIKSRAKFRASEQPGLCDRLVALANDWHHIDAQMFSIQALTNICEHPRIRKEVYDKYFHILEKIVVGNNENIRHYKATLLELLKWTP